jgi:four helix bundle protein
MKGQISRAAISVMNNIAEGFGRISKRDFIRFLEISQTSANEVKRIDYAAQDQNYWSPEDTNMIQNKAEDVKSLDLGLIRYLTNKT